jgi:hypothetical protein
MMDKIRDNKQLIKVINLLSSSRGYLLGVTMGLALIIINMYIGLSMITLILDGQHYIPIVEGISLPVIRERDYHEAKEVYLERQNKRLVGDVTSDPFRL